MTIRKGCAGHQFGPGQNSRITGFGRVLRQTKLDELPELLNILKGDMSIVGPRPEVPKYVNMYPEEFASILHVRPGLSDYASIKYRNEEELLASAPDPEEYYRRVILPDKLRSAQHYTETISFKTDWQIIFETMKRVLRKTKERERLEEGKGHLSASRCSTRGLIHRRQVKP